MIDPGFIFYTANMIRENQVVKAEVQQAIYEQAEVEKQADLLQKRLEILNSSKQASTDILHLVSVNPQQAFVQAQLTLQSLDSWGVISDSFEELQDKEQAQLIWRKLVNISEKCQSLMTKEILESCMQCLNAIQMERFIRFTAQRIEAYQQYQQVNQKIAHYKAVKKRVDRDFLLISIAIVIISMFLSLWLGIVLDTLSNPIWTGMTIVMASILELTAGMMLLRRLPKDIQQTQQLYNQYFEEAYINNSTFWENVKTVFGEIPSEQQLQQKWDEQELIIQPFFTQNAKDPANEK